jgi:hypothetical protein
MFKFWKKNSKNGQSKKMIFWKKNRIKNKNLSDFNKIRFKNISSLKKWKYIIRKKEHTWWAVAHYTPGPHYPRSVYRSIPPPGPPYITVSLCNNCNRAGLAERFAFIEYGPRCFGPGLATLGTTETDGCFNLEIGMLISHAKRKVDGSIFLF